jgi:choline dehydrogenase-like flavoprotein
LSAPLKKRLVYFIVFVERYLTRIRKVLWRLAVSYEVPTGSRELTAVFRFNSESTVSAGAVNSSHLPMASAIGTRKHLKDLNINVIRDLEVGYNLMDPRMVSDTLVVKYSVSIVSEKSLG